MTTRIARICMKCLEETGCSHRYFGDPTWQCDKHPRSAIDQPNVPYMKKRGAREERKRK